MIRISGKRFFFETKSKAKKFTEFKRILIKNERLKTNDLLLWSSHNMVLMQCTGFGGCKRDMYGYAVMILKDKTWRLCFILKQTKDYIFGFDYIGFDNILLSNKLSIYKRGLFYKNFFVYVCVMPLYENAFPEVEYKAVINEIDWCVYCNKCPSRINLGNQKKLLSNEDVNFVFMKKYLKCNINNYNITLSSGERFSSSCYRRSNNKSNIDRAFIDKPPKLFKKFFECFFD